MIRQMTEGDVKAALVIEHELFGDETWTENMLLGELADQPRTRHYVVLEEDGEIIGYAGLSAAGGEADVQTIGVRTAHQGRGLGKALLTELLEEAERRGCTAVFLEVRADNTTAQGLYERFGFERIGLRRGYYQPSGMDAVVMRRGKLS
ncbi:ribosomal protein S18-alanine N-acetyltransferase [Actinocorallia longicatena]|uniref:[Ribosomal protein bS18]-alanine N-acetyltransferase n=1 Tax=Actinocorallia longicatena TaxID=111803 RepID=A0ABP6Q652_9ACTN